MTETTLIILLDAFRWDYLNPKDTPFLWRLKDSGIWAKKLFNNGGYCERSCFATGAPPEITKNMFAFSLLSAGYKRAYWEPRFNIPLELRMRLAMKEDNRFDYEPYAFGVESFWDVARREKKTWEFQACGALGTLTYETGRYTENIRWLALIDAFEKEKDFYFWQISEIDQWGHIYGVQSPAFRGILRWADSMVEKVIKTAQKRFSGLKMLVFGDHGMMDVEKKVDLNLDFFPFVEGWDYLYLKSSAAIQFWTFNRGVAKRILEDRKLREYGRFIESPHFSQGDLIWQANKGVLVSPCHFHSKEDAPKAMHGYDIDGKEGVEEMRGMAIVVDGGNKGIIEEGKLTDICPTICDLLKIDYPKENRGKSFLKEVKRNV